jgi:hypothetical protein
MVTLTHLHQPLLTFKAGVAAAVGTSVRRRPSAFLLPMDQN